MNSSLKCTQDKSTAFLLLLVLGASMLHTALSLILLLMVSIMMVLSIKNSHSSNNEDRTLRKIDQESYLLGFFVVLLYLFQNLILELSLDDMMSALCIISAIFIMIFVEKFLLKSLSVPLAFFHATTWFNILFSCYYLLRVAIYGLPNDRDSVLGYVSSNYCAAILFLSFPLLLYYLYTIRKTHALRRGIRIRTYVSLFLSILVIIISGSRTAFVTVLFIFLSLLIFRQKDKKAKIKMTFSTLTAAAGIYITYLYIPSVQLLLDRAMSVMKSSGSVGSDVRTIIWASAFYNFKSYNQLIGSGSNMVYQFSRPAHNFLIEILLSCGYIGVFLFFLCLIRALYRLLKNSNYEKRFFILQLLIVYALVAYVQPFFSTAFTCGIIVWGSMFSIFFDQ